MTDKYQINFDNFQFKVYWYYLQLNGFKMQIIEYY